MTRTLANPVAHVCRVCGRRAQLDDLCGRHGGSAGLIIQTEDLPRTMRIALRSMVTGGILTMVLGLLTALTGGSLTGRDDATGAAKTAGLVMIAVGFVTVVLSMYLSQLRPWAWPASIALCGGAGVIAAVLLVVTSTSSSFVTLLVACTVFPYVLAAVLVVVWRVRQPPSAARVRDAGALDAKATS